MVGRDSSPSGIRELAKGTHQLTRQKHLHGLTSDVAAWMAGATPEDVYKGLQLHSALMCDRQTTKMILFAELARTWRSVRVGMEKTWLAEEDLQTAIDDILEMFPTLKIEEILYVFGRIRRGQVKLYGRLDTPTIFEAIFAHEMEWTIPLREKENTARKFDEWVDKEQTLKDWLKQDWSKLGNIGNLGA